jgi:HEAT repeat protein
MGREDAWFMQAGRDTMGSVRQLLRFQVTAPDIERLRERKDLGQLIHLLQYPDVTVQWKAAEALGTLGPEAVDHLLNALLEHDLPGKLGAIEALAGIRDTRAVTPLINLLKYDTNSEIQWASAIALGEIGDPRAVSPLRDALMNPDKYVRFGSAVALRHLGWLPDSPEDRTCQLIALQEWEGIIPLGKAATVPLSRAVTDPDPEVRYHAIETLERLHARVPQDVCGSMLRDTDGKNRWKAIIAAKKWQVPVSYLPWALSKRTRTRKSPEAAAILNFLFLGLGYNYLGKWWGFLVFQIYMTTLLMFTLFPVKMIGTYIFLVFFQIPGIPIQLPVSAIFAIHAWSIARKMPDL